MANRLTQVFTYNLLLTLIGPEDRGRSMRAFNDDDILDVKSHHHAVVEGNLEEVATNQIPQRKAPATELIERV